MKIGAKENHPQLFKNIKRKERKDLLKSFRIEICYYSSKKKFTHQKNLYNSKIKFSLHRFQCIVLDRFLQAKKSSQRPHKRRLTFQTV